MSGHRRSGMTLMQILVTIAVVAVILAILLPAIQRARASSRRLACRDRLRQITITATSYADQHRGRFPARLMELLPGVDQGPSHKALKAFEAAVKKDVAEHGFSQRKRPKNEGANPQLVCPEDAFADPRQYESNYFINGGTTFRLGRSNTANGIMGQNPNEPARLSGIPDGTSNTALYSERLHPDINQLPPPGERYAWSLPGITETPDELLALYEKQDDWLSPMTQDGLLEQITTAHTADIIVRTTRYDHILLPNSRPVFDRGIGARRRVSLPATSLHGAGVHVAFCDGHVRFIAEEIDLEVWRAIGTRNGREVVNSTDF